MKLIVVATPKSGNHWLKALLAEAYGLSEVSIDKIAECDNAICHDHLLPDEPHLRWLSNNEITPITIFRHPADVLVSLYHFVWMKNDTLPEEQSILRDEGSIGEGTLEYARVHLYPLLMCSELWRIAGAPYVRYEDLVANPVSTLEALASSLKPVKDDAIRRAILLSSFSLKRESYDADPDLKPGKNFFRRGGTGYREELTSEIMALLGTEPFVRYMSDVVYTLFMEPIIPFDIDRLDPFRGHREFTNGVPISSKLHRLLLSMPDLTTWPRPWEESDRNSLYRWLNAPEYPGAQLTNLMRLVYLDRPDLREVFPEVDESPREFQLWFLTYAGAEYEVGAEFVAPVRTFVKDSGETLATSGSRLLGTAAPFSMSDGFLRTASSQSRSGEQERPASSMMASANRSSSTMSPARMAMGALASQHSGFSVSRQDRPEDDLIDTRPMKWFFAVNDVSLQLQRDFWQSMILAAVRSALQHTDLAPHLLFDGDDDPFLPVLERLGVTVVRHRVSIYDALERHDGGSDYLKVASGAFLRTEIPAIEDDPFVLYTDCDVMFTGDVSLGNYRPHKFACAPEFQQDDYADFNTGVMVMNVKGLRDDLDEFTAFIRGNLSSLQAYDQGAYRMFYEGRVDPLDPIYNWKPYWGTSREARIVHFHGVKPRHVEGLVYGETLPPALRNLYDRNPVSYQQYVQDWTTLAGHA